MRTSTGGQRTQACGFIGIHGSQGGRMFMPKGSPVLLPWMPVTDMDNGHEVPPEYGALVPQDGFEPHGYPLGAARLTHLCPETYLHTTRKRIQWKMRWKRRKRTDLGSFKWMAVTIYCRPADSNSSLVALWQPMDTCGEYVTQERLL
jgi:hypothetical protein